MKYKLKADFLDVGMGLMHSILPQTTEARDIAKELGFTSPADVGLPSKISSWVSKKGYEEVSILGGIVGAPMGFFPMLMDYYSGGEGDKIRKTMARYFETFRLDPNLVVQLWRRAFPNEEDKEKWFADLKDTGWNEERIEALKELAFILPTPQDLVTWQAREVFEPDAIEKYGLDDEFEKLDLSLFAKVGISEENAKNYWRAHWQHASWLQMVEMRRRGWVTDYDIWEWFRLVEIPPFWREKLMALVWEVPTRVDVRRFWDMGTIDEERLRTIYQAQGYHNQDLEDYVLWTKVYVALPDLVSRYKNGYIPLETVMSELITLGMSKDRATELMETKVKKVYAPERVATERNLTVTDIIMSIKKGNITREEGVSMIMELGYGSFEAEFKIDARIASEGSPESYLEHMVIIDEYKRSQGIETKIIPPELLEADKSFTNLQKRLNSAITEGQPVDVAAHLRADLEIARAKYEDLFSLYRA